MRGVSRVMEDLSKFGGASTLNGWPERFLSGATPPLSHSALFWLSLLKHPLE